LEKKSMSDVFIFP